MPSSSPGIIRRLDYLDNLGIKNIWISPIYKSPMKDFGYDISNFTMIDPLFGTMQDFKNMVSGMHARGKISLKWQVALKH